MSFFSSQRKKKQTSGYEYKTKQLILFLKLPTLNQPNVTEEKTVGKRVLLPRQTSVSFFSRGSSLIVSTGFLKDTAIKVIAPV